MAGIHNFFGATSITVKQGQTIKTNPSKVLATKLEVTPNNNRARISSYLSLVPLLSAVYHLKYTQLTMMKLAVLAALAGSAAAFAPAPTNVKSTALNTVWDD